MAPCAPKCTSTARLDGKTAIITGSNSGIGKYTALDFCRRGCRVIMACRNVQKAEEAREEILKELEKADNSNKIGQIKVKHLDLTSLASVRQCAKELLDEEFKIHLLINNGGVYGCPYALTEDGYETQLATNHLGHYLFTLLLLPRIIRSAPARIVNVSSSLHQNSLGRKVDKNFEDINYEAQEYTPFGAYGRSKLANILFTKELAKRLEGKNVNVYVLHPGFVKTNAARHWKKDHPYLSAVVDMVMGWAQRTVEQGAQTTIYCAVDEKAANESGEYYEDCKVATPSEDARDVELAKKLWDLIRFRFCIE